MFFVCLCLRIESVDSIIFSAYFGLISGVISPADVKQ